MSSAQHLLDHVQSPSATDALAADPAQYAQALAAELQPATTIGELEAQDAVLAHALQRIDELAARVMRIRLDHVLASDTSIGQPTRRVFASTIVSYANSLPLLADRVRDLASRGGAADPAQVTDTVVEAARETLALRDGLRDGVLALIKDRATAATPEADKRARDKNLDDKERKRWSAVRRDLEQLAGEPAKILAAPFTARLAAWPEQLDEPDPGPEVTFADMIELD